MIRFHDIPSNEAAVDHMVAMAKQCGVPAAEAQELADKAASLVIATFRGFDEKIEAMTKDPVDQAMIQQMVMMHLAGIAEQTMRLNAIRGLLNIIGMGAKL